jgi:hypothetical protein
VKRPAEQEQEHHELEQLYLNDILNKPHICRPAAVYLVVLVMRGRFDAPSLLVGQKCRGNRHASQAPATAERTASPAGTALGEGSGLVWQDSASRNRTRAAPPSPTMVPNAHAQTQNPHLTQYLTNRMLCAVVRVRCVCDMCERVPTRTGSTANGPHTLGSQPYEIYRRRPPPFERTQLAARPQARRHHWPLRPDTSTIHTHTHTRRAHTTPTRSEVCVANTYFGLPRARVPVVLAGLGSAASPLRGAGRQEVPARRLAHLAAARGDAQVRAREDHPLPSSSAVSPPLTHVCVVPCVQTAAVCTASGSRPTAPIPSSPTPAPTWLSDTTSAIDILFRGTEARRTRHTT